MRRPAWARRPPLLVGPWHSEMGFEILYWVPYVTQIVQREGLDADDLVILTRGGAGAWYPPGRRVELYQYAPPQDLRLLALESQHQRGSINQVRRMTGYERRLLALVAERIGLRRYRTLHPSVMYRALEPFWRTQQMGLGALLSHLRMAPVPPCQVPLGTQLPEAFVAMRWYQRATWPLRPDLLAWTQAVVEGIAKTYPVVILRSSDYLDDHVDFPVPTGPNITVVTADPWTDNLAIQTAILQRALGFVGTWGGMAQLAVRCGIPTVAFYDRWVGCSYQHLVLTQWLALQQGQPCVVGRPCDLDKVRAVLPTGIPVPDPPKGSSS